MGGGSKASGRAGVKPPRIMKLRYDGTCAGCEVALAAGSEAQWDPSAKTTTCLACVSQQAEEPASSSASPPAPDLATADTPATTALIDPGTAGASAQREHDRRKAKREEKVRTDHPRIGRLILALSDDPHSTKAWAKGAVGERKLGEALDALRSEEVVVLHDRRVPRSRANIDHVVIASSGIHVIDAKRYTGKVEVRATGSIFRPGPQKLLVANRDKSNLVTAMAGQVEVVHAAIADLFGDTDPTTLIRPALCFVDAEWSWGAKPMHLHGVRISGPKSLVPMIAEPGPLSPEQVLALGTRLAERLVPA